MGFTVCSSYDWASGSSHTCVTSIIQTLFCQSISWFIWKLFSSSFLQAYTVKHMPIAQYNYYTASTYQYADKSSITLTKNMKKRKSSQKDLQYIKLKYENLNYKCHTFQANTIFKENIKSHKRQIRGIYDNNPYLCKIIRCFTIHTWRRNNKLIGF